MFDPTTPWQRIICNSMGSLETIPKNRTAAVAAGLEVVEMKAVLS